MELEDVAVCSWRTRGGMECSESATRGTEEDMIQAAIVKDGETFRFYSDLLSARPIPSCKRRAVHELIWNNVMVIRVIDSAAMYVMRPTSHISAVIVAIQCACRHAVHGAPQVR